MIRVYHLLNGASRPPPYYSTERPWFEMVGMAKSKGYNLRSSLLVEKHNSSCQSHLDWGIQGVLTHDPMANLVGTKLV
ncbi:hypothetical protein TNCT_157991 [Trichonephila clavata]|uniref:Uncharacterized protein n=1 Tax=Trichonephila clavata TaxID=2740835 RepID=A0A8X6LVX1_TRICU|nr:hypothetical protein TNCT_157991 [Trichonephila clavata]